MTITHKELKRLRSLAHKKYRREEGQFLVEGWRLVHELLKSRTPPLELLVAEDVDQTGPRKDLLALAEHHSIPIMTVSLTQSEQLAETRQPQGIFALAELPHLYATPSAVEPPLLILDAVNDPGNTGTLLRTADWFGIATVWASGEGADLYNPKVVRGAMGAHFHIRQLYQGDPAAAAATLAQSGCTLFAATLSGKSIDEVTEIPGKWALILGNEVRGPSDFWREYLPEEVTIGGSGSAESLNVAVAGGILMHHFFRYSRH